MERLTKRSDFTGLILIDGRGYGEAYFGAKEDYDRITKALEKLAAYEDAELTPEEFHESVAFVLELNKKLKPYIDAYEQGRLVILPCKVEDTLYAPTRNIISEFRVSQFDFGGYAEPFLWVNWYLTKGITGNFRIDGIKASEIGKTVFLTRAEAENALKGEPKNV